MKTYTTEELRESLLAMSIYMAGSSAGHTERRHGRRHRRMVAGGFGVRGVVRQAQGRRVAVRVLDGHESCRHGRNGKVAESNPRRQRRR